jgi:hypothetical protein
MTTQTTSNSEVECGVCGTPQGQHGGMNHKFSAEGILEVVEPQKQRKSSAPSSIDIPLRLLLIDKGLITQEDLTVKEMQLRDKLRGAAAPGRGDPEGDHEDR